MNGPGLRGAPAVVVVIGGVLGVALGAVLANVLVAVLSGVFDPPPSALAVPWIYLALLATAVVGGIAAACAGVSAWERRADVAVMREQ